MALGNKYHSFKRKGQTRIKGDGEKYFYLVCSLQLKELANKFDLTPVS